MSKFEKFISKFQLVRIRSRKLTVIVLVVAIVLSMGALTVLHLSRKQLQNRTDELREQAAHLELENAALQEDIDQVGSIQSIVEIAEKELGLVQPDAVFFETAP
jgi:cell division protein FtsL